MSNSLTEDGLCTKLQKELSLPREEVRAQGHPTLRREEAFSQEAGTNGKNLSSEDPGHNVDEEKRRHDRLARWGRRLWNPDPTTGPESGWPYSNIVVPYDQEASPRQRWKDDELKGGPGSLLSRPLREINNQNERQQPVQTPKNSIDVPRNPGS